MIRAGQARPPKACRPPSCRNSETRNASFHRTVHDLLVGPFEIECIDEGLPQTLIPQFFPSRIEEPTLRARGGIVWNDIALDVPLADRREVVACRPSPRYKFFPEQIASCSEPLEGNFAIAVIFVAHDVKIVLPAPDWQVRPPPVFHSLV